MPNASARASSACHSPRLCPGRAVIRSKLTRAKCACAAAIAASPSSTLCALPKKRKVLVSSACIPIETRLTPALANAATAQGTANAALTSAAAAQSTANAAVAQNNIQDTQIAAIQVLNTTQNARLTALETLSLGAIPALQALTNTHSAQISELFALTDRDRRQARRGTATALALTAAAMPSTPGGVGYALNVSNYRSEQAIGLSVAIRTNGDKPFAVTGGVSFAGSKDIGARVGVAGEF